MCPLGRSGWPCTPDRNSRRPSALRRGVEFRQNATSTLGRRPYLRLDAMERVAASFYSTCLIRAELQNAEGSKNLQYNGSTIGGRQELKFPRIVAPLRKFGRPSTAAHKAGVDVLGSVGSQRRNGLATGFRHYSRLHMDFVFMRSALLGARRRVQDFRERLPLTKSRIDNPPRSSWNFTSFTPLTRKVQMDP